MWVFINGAIVDLEKYSALTQHKSGLHKEVTLNGVTNGGTVHYITTFATEDEAILAMTSLLKGMKKDCCEEKCKQS